MSYSKSEDEIDLQVEGHPQPLFYSPGTNSCGSIKDGVAFRFGGEACWVLSLETLRKIVKSEDLRRNTAPSKRNN